MKHYEHNGGQISMLISDILDTLALNKFLTVEIPAELVSELEPLMPDNYFLQTLDGRTAAVAKTGLLEGG